MSFMNGKVEQTLTNDAVSNVRSWKTIDRYTDTLVYNATCKRCGESVSSEIKQVVLDFKANHAGRNNVCPYEKEVTY